MAEVCQSIRENIKHASYFTEKERVKIIAPNFYLARKYFLQV